MKKTITKQIIGRFIIVLFVLSLFCTLCPYVFSDSYYLWEDWGGSGIYDVEKSPTNYDDDLLCWAAATSNILDWTGWGNVSETINDNNDIFQYYQDHWSDQGGHSYYGTKWWFDGETPETQGLSGWSQLEVAGGNFWPEDNFYANIQLTQDKTLTLAAIDSFLHNGYAIALGVQGPGGHAITCWGIEYENGNYTKIWVTDSDDSKSELTPPDLLRGYDVLYENDKWYLQDFYNDDTWYISDVFGLESKSIDPIYNALTSAFDLGLSLTEIQDLIRLYNDGKSRLSP